MRDQFSRASEKCGWCVRPRCYYLSLLLGLILSSASLVRRSAAWGHITPGDLTDTNFGYNRQYEYWLNPLTMERCDIYKGGTLLWYVEVGTSYEIRSTAANGARLCYEFDYIKWQEIWKGTRLEKWLTKCNATGITSYVFMIAAMVTFFAGFVMVRCLNEQTGPTVQYVVTFVSICFLITGLATFYWGCVLSQESAIFNSFGRVRTFALGYVYAVGGMLCFLHFTCIHVYAIYITPPKFFGGASEDDWNENSFAQAREAARSQDNGTTQTPTELQTNGQQNDAWANQPTNAPETNASPTNADPSNQQRDPYAEPAAGGWQGGGGAY